MKHWKCVVLSLVLLSSICSKSGPGFQPTAHLVFRVGPSATLTPEAALDETKAAVFFRLLNSPLRADAFVYDVPPDQLSIPLPAMTPEDVESVKAIVTRKATLEFAILANQHDHAALIAKAEADENPVSDSGRFAEWRPIAPDAAGKPRDLALNDPFVLRTVERDGIAVKESLLVLGSPSSRITEVNLADAHELRMEDGRMGIGVHLDDRGGYLMKVLSNDNQPVEGLFHRRMAIIIDGTIHSAPRINATFGKDFVIEGEFSEAELKELVSALSKPLPAPVTFVELRQVKPGG